MVSSPLSGLWQPCFCAVLQLRRIKKLALFFLLYINTIKLGEILFFYAEFLEKFKVGSAEEGKPPLHNTTA